MRNVKRSTIKMLLLIIMITQADIQIVEASISPGQLQCEYLENPAGIDVVEPRLSWVLQVPDPQQRGLKQTGYQVLVASSRELLNKDEGDLWNTGKINSDQSIHIGYEGKTLKSRQKCFWKVRIWDKNGNVSPYSKPASWEMGLLDKTDWQAKWISAPKVYSWYELDRDRKSIKWSDRSAQVDPSPFFRKPFSISRTVKKATVYVTGLGYHELYINGRKVGDHVLDPGVTHYNKRVLYVTHDITGQIKQGRNALGAILGTGWYNMHTYAVWGFDKAPWRARPALICQLEIEFEDGSKKTIVSDDSWKVSRGPLLFDGIRNGEIYDARREMPNWDSEPFDDGSWNSVETTDGPKGRLCAQMLPPIKVMRTIRPQKITEPKPDVFVFDMGENIAGWAQLKVSGPAGTEVTLKYGEKLNEDGTVKQEQIERFTKQWDVQKDTYILKGEGTEIWEPRFVYHGFQYVEVKGFPGIPEPENLSGRVVNTAFDKAGTLTCSNEIINKIQNICVQSYTNNYHSYPTDCPQREKLGWTAEGHLGAEQGLFNFYPQSAYTKWMNDLKDAQRENGQFPGIVPTSGWGYSLTFADKPQGFGPSWDGASILIPWYLYQFSGDQRILAVHYAGMKKYMQWLTKESDDYIIRFGLGDWTPVKTKAPDEVTTTGYYLSFARILSDIAKILEHESDARYFRELAEKIRKSYNEKYFHPETGLYADGSQTALACALFHGFPEPENIRQVADNLVSNIEKNNGFLDTGQFGAKCILPALSETGHADVAYSLASQTEFPSWGEWVTRGATTIWERWRGESSLNHTAYGTITVWFYKYLAGIRHDLSGPGFKKIIIKPEITGDLKWVKGTYNCMYGEIVSHWSLDGEVVTLEVTIPPNTTATVYVPVKERDDVKEGGKAIENAENVTFLKMDEGRAVYYVGSGNYRFSSTIRKK